jgi:predicted ribosome quality control (RQC) complex YloA/Tae2 family protein
MKSSPAHQLTSSLAPIRTHISNKGTLFLAGRTDETNEILMSQVKPNELIFHTEMPGSPFVNIKGELKEGDVEEAAIMCARYSRDYKKHKDDVKVHYFLGKNTRKSKFMKTGTFGVKKVKEIIVKLKDIEEFKANPAKKGQLMEFQKQGLI